MRAADADRERVAERLRTALNEGRLTLDEYDSRVREAYAAKTYTELDQLLTDLPGAAPVARSQVAVPHPESAEPRRAVPGWMWMVWGGWASVVAINVVIWTVASVGSGRPVYFWPFWVAVPWGAVLLMRTLGGRPFGWGRPRRRRSHR
jgi:hypothetical protein